MTLRQLIYISVQLTIKFNSTQFRLYSYTKFDLLVLGAVKIFRWLHRKRLKAIHYFHKELHIRCGRSRSASENWNIVADNRDNFSSDIIKTSIFLHLCTSIISARDCIGAGQVFIWISNDVFIFRENFIIGAIWW